MTGKIQDYNAVFFIGIAGVGMSAIAQYLAGTGLTVSGSDRYFLPGTLNDTRDKLEGAGITCYSQDGQGIHENLSLVVVSTAIEDSVPEVIKARSMNIPILRRSEVLSMIANTKKTIAVAGTSGKSSTCAMLFDILEHAGMEPSIISGAGLVSIIKDGLIGNAKVGRGDWLVIEADESDGSIVQYQASVGLLINIDKDHQEISELLQLFEIFRKNTKDLFITNLSHPLTKNLSRDEKSDFSSDQNSGAGYIATDFEQQGLLIRFKINGTVFVMNTPGKHNMENALAAVAVAHQLGVSLDNCSATLKHYEGIYRRHQVLGKKNGTWVIDDYAHNPAKCAASIAACQPLAEKVIAWFQPHGYGPTKFLRADFVKDIAAVLREQDEIWMSEIFYAGGTAVKDISANDLINDLRDLKKNAFFVADRSDLLPALRPHLADDAVLLLMGARDPGLEAFAKKIFEQL